MQSMQFKSTNPKTIYLFIRLSLFFDSPSHISVDDMSFVVFWNER